MTKLVGKLAYFSKVEYLLWGISLLSIFGAYLIFDRGNPTSMIASLIGATSLIFCAKGNPIGQALMIIFSAIYAVISFSFSYYGEMITYLGMTLPMAVLSMVTWLKNPYNGNKSQVTVNRLYPKEILLMLFLTGGVTLGFYHILGAFHTANLVPSTISVTTSFIAAYLTLRRSPYYALAYAANDIVLIVLWILASIRNSGYLSVVICFVIFLANDLYGFVSWKKMEKQQRTSNS